MATPLSSLTYAAVIKIIPLAIEWVLREGCVMTTTATTEMIWYAEAIINQLLAPLLRMEYVGAHVKALKRKLHQSINFLATKSIFATGRLKAFEAYDQYAWNAVNFKCFGRLNKILTPVAIPFVVLVECLRLLKVIKAMA